MKRTEFDRELLDLIKDAQDWDDPVDFGRLRSAISDFAWPLVEKRNRTSFDEGYFEGQQNCDCGEPLYPAVGDLTRNDLRSGMALLAADPTSASVYLDRVLRDFGEPGFHNGKLL